MKDIPRMSVVVKKKRKRSSAIVVDTDEEEAGGVLVRAAGEWEARGEVYAAMAEAEAELRKIAEEEGKLKKRRAEYHAVLEAGYKWLAEDA